MAAELLISNPHMLLTVAWHPCVCRSKSMLTAETEDSLAERRIRRRDSFPPPRSRVSREIDIGRGCCMPNERVGTETACVSDGRHADNGGCVVIERMAQRTDKPPLQLLMNEATDSGSDVERLGGTESSGQLGKTEGCVHPPVIVRRFRKSVSRSRSELMKRHSSSSDVSARLSRNSVDLERFFNSMGLERSVLEPMLSEPTTRAPSSSAALNLCDCSSSLTSANPRSVYSDDSHNDPLTSRASLDAAHKSGGSSIVERNARIIKWLYGVKKAQPPRHDGSLTQ